MKKFSLTPHAYDILINKATEKPNSGKYNIYGTDQVGTYLCRLCGTSLFHSDAKFLSSCGWPSFDREIANKVKKVPDSDGKRIEILCNNCDAHLGHIFRGENYTRQNIRYCVNSASVEFVNNIIEYNTEEIILAGGCFWGIEYKLQNLDGVLLTEVGYIGGDINYPNYKKVCSGKTGHMEGVRVIFDISIISYEDLLNFFMSIHDSSKANQEGVDIGTQYQSAIFYYNEKQKKIATKILELYKENNYSTTKIIPIRVFWPAEELHQNYIKNRQSF